MEFFSCTMLTLYHVSQCRYYCNIVQAACLCWEDRNLSLLYHSLSLPHPHFSNLPPYPHPPFPLSSLSVVGGTAHCIAWAWDRWDIQWVVGALPAFFCLLYASACQHSFLPWVGLLIISSVFGGTVTLHFGVDMGQHYPT